MPKLRAPELHGLSYNAHRIAPGAEVAVLDRDVEDLLTAGWTRVSAGAKTKAPEPTGHKKPAKETEL